MFPPQLTPEEEAQVSLSNPDVVTKYKAAARIVNQAIAAIVAAAKPGTLVTDLCDLGDTFMNDAVAKEFKGKDEENKPVEKGIAVPTCISVNHCVGHWSPVESAQTLKDGDVVKIDLGCHIDGFASQAGHTFVVGASKVTGREADVMQCAKDCYEAAARLIKPGAFVDDVPPVLEKIAKHYGVSHVEGVMTNQMNRFIIDSGKVILNRPSDNPEQQFQNAMFEEGEVYAIDVIVSTGSGKPKMIDEKETTVFKRNYGHLDLKVKASRQLISQIDKRFPTMLFSLRNLDGGIDTKVKLAVQDLSRSGMITHFPVTWEKEGEQVAQVKGTFLLMPNGSDRLNSFPQDQVVESDKKATLDDEVKALLSTSLKPKKKKNKA